jgi:hypothetical protein
MMDRQNKKRKAQHEVQNDIVKGPDLFQDAEIIYPHGDRNEVAKVVSRKRNNDNTLDPENVNTLWEDVVKKEAGGGRIAFEIKEDGIPPPGYKPVQLMVMFDIKMDLTTKARLVARGELTETPPALTYSSVVTRESVRIAFTMAALNDLDLMMFDVGNAYLMP